MLDGPVGFDPANRGTVTSLRWIDFDCSLNQAIDKAHMQLQEKIALISGASRNIGRVIALKFAREGAHLILVARQNMDALKEVAKECETFGIRALPLQADVSNHDEVNHMVAR